MAKSDLWRELAEKFHSVWTIYDFSAYRTYYLDSTADPTWTFGSAEHTGLATFDAMARRGAGMLEAPLSDDLVMGWLEALWHEATHGSVRSTSEIIGQPQFPAEELRVPVQLRGKIDRVFQSSSALCRKFESRALQAEFEEKKGNDPRNWSQFRQQYEAFKGIRELHNEPAKRIPEEFVRNAIARIHNIKPEEVTPQQINFEVAGLLSSTKRHIELIPSTARQESPVAETKHEYVGIEPARKREEPEPVQTYVANETVGEQLQRLREECRWTIPDLAEATGLSDRQVARHLSGKFKPLPRNISAYERAFCKRLQRKVVINKMS